MRAKGTSVGMSRLLNTRISEIAWAILISLLLFQPELQRLVPSLTWLDEVATFLLVVNAIAKSSHIHQFRSRDVFGCLLWLTVFILSCFVGNFMSGIPGDFQPLAIDMFTCIKFFVSALSGIVIFSDLENLKSILTSISKVLLAIIAICALLSAFIDIGMSYGEIRYGLQPFEFVFTHPTYLVTSLAGLIIVLSADAKKNMLWIGLASLLLILTLRGKAVGFAALVFIIILFTRRGKKSISPFQVIILGVVALVIGWGQIEAYFGSEGQARFELLRAALQLSLDQFPFGSGFASFGSAITAESDWYSPLYYQYGIASVWGLSQDYSAFISDSFWPTVLGQSGWVGLIAYCNALFMLIKSINERIRIKLPLVLFVSYSLIMSTSESAFFNPSIIYLVICTLVAAFSSPPTSMDFYSDKLLTDNFT